MARWGVTLTLGTLVAMLVAACSSSAVGGEGAPAATASPVGSLRDVVTQYTRFGQAGDERDLELTYAPPAFFETFDQDVPVEVATDRAMLFLLRENVHEGELPDRIVEVAVRLPDGGLVPPSSIELLTEDVHHRSSRILFPVAASSLERIEVVVVSHGEVVPSATPFVWTNPAALAGSAGTEDGEQ